MGGGVLTPATATSVVTLTHQCPCNRQKYACKHTHTHVCCLGCRLGTLITRYRLGTQMTHMPSVFRPTACAANADRDRVGRAGTRARAGAAAGAGRRNWYGVCGRPLTRMVALFSPLTCPSLLLLAGVITVITVMPSYKVMRPNKRPRPPRICDKSLSVLGAHMPTLAKGCLNASYCTFTLTFHSRIPKFSVYLLGSAEP